MDNTGAETGSDPAAQDVTPFVSLPYLTLDNADEFQAAFNAFSQNATVLARARDGLHKLPAEIARVRAAIAELESQISSSDGRAEARARMGLDASGETAPKATPALRKQLGKLEDELASLVAAQSAGPEVFEPMRLQHVALRDELLRTMRAATDSVDGWIKQSIEALDVRRGQLEAFRSFAMLGVDAYKHHERVFENPGLPVDAELIEMLSAVKRELAHAESLTASLLPPPAKAPEPPREIKVWTDPNWRPREEEPEKPSRYAGIPYHG